MIERYSNKELKKIWSDENRFRIWLDIEIATCEVWESLGKIPKGTSSKIRKCAKFDVNRINEIEETVKHDVIAFLTNISESVGDDSKYIHMGLTSSDILDTCLSIQISMASEIILKEICKVNDILYQKAHQYKHTMMIGRSHGIHAEPITFGLKLALWYDEMQRNKERLISSTENIKIGKISGAVGTYAHCPPKIEEYVCKKLGLKPDNISTQIIQRDRHAEYMTTLAIIASSLDKFSTEIRHLQRTEVLEVEEPFTKGQKGSSAMPHKRNPIKSENICGLARIIRANSMVALENIVLWHERDISHSSAERIIFPDSTLALYHMLFNFRKVIDGLNVYPDNMKGNLEITSGLYNSQRVMLKLIERGLSREKSYEIVQRNAMKFWNETEMSFFEYLSEDSEFTPYITVIELKELFEPEFYIKSIDHTWNKVFGDKK